MCDFNDDSGEEHDTKHSSNSQQKSTPNISTAPSLPLCIPAAKRSMYCFTLNGPLPPLNKHRVEQRERGVFIIKSVLRATVHHEAGLGANTRVCG